MLRVHPFGLAHRLMPGHGVVPPHIAPARHWHGLTGALQHNHVAHARTPARERLVGGGLELDYMPGAPATVGRDDQLCLGVLDAILERRSRKAAKHHRMDGADAIAGMHSHQNFRHQWHINDDAIAAPDPVGLQRVGKETHLRVQLPITEVPHVTGFALEDNRGLVTSLGEVHVKAIHGGIELTVGEPAVVRGATVIQRARERYLPLEFLRAEFRPESNMIRARAAIQVLEVRRLDAGPRGEGRRRRKAALFLEDRFDVLIRHDVLARLLQQVAGRGLNSITQAHRHTDLPLPQQPLDHRARLPGIGATEQIGVVEHMVEVVKLCP